MSLTDRSAHLAALWRAVLAAAARCRRAPGDVGAAWAYLDARAAWEQAS